MTRFALIVGMLAFTLSGYAQSGPFGYYEDALRYSQTNYSLGSTARMQAIGGAQISLGGDISSAVSNPAGLGFFNKSTFAITPALNFSTVDTRFSVAGDPTGLSSSEESFKNNFNIANVGAAINWNKGRFSEDKFKGGTLAITINRVSNYNLERSYEGTNNYNSQADALAAGAGTVDPNDLGELAFAAYDQYLISPVLDGSDNITGYVADFDGVPIQNEFIRQRGSHYQMNIAWGGNYDDRLYFGGGMGVQLLNYRQSRTYREFDFAVFDNNDNFVGEDTRLNGFTMYDDLDIRGTGINFNAGVIARPFDFMTVGLSYTSPSFISLDEESFTDLDANWKSSATFADTVALGDIDPFQSPLFISGYNVRTPSRLGVGATFFVGKSGFLSGDVEFVDYSNARIKSNDFSESADNDVINAAYESAINIRVGGEYRIDDFRLRAGYALMPSPYAESNLGEQTSITFGIGYRTSDYFVDLAVVNSERTISYLPYEIAARQPVATSDIKNTSVAITFGINF